MALKINQQSIDIQQHDGDMPLLWFLREVMQLTATRYGCGKGLCGACTVIANGAAVRSCSLTIRQADGMNITTIENADSKEALAVKAAWEDTSVPQCGYCQSGQIMSATALLQKNPSPNEDQIVYAMQGNICRCGTYPRIKRAISIASQSIDGEG